MVKFNYYSLKYIKCSRQPRNFDPRNFIQVFRLVAVEHSKLTYYSRKASIVYFPSPVMHVALLR